MSKPGRKHKRYTEKEDGFLLRNYPTMGAKWCAKRTKRTPKSIWARARRLGISFGDVEGKVTAAELANETTISVRSVQRIMKSRQVCEKIGITTGSGSRLVVADEWAADFLEEQRKKAEAETLGYLNSKQACEVLGISYGTLRRGLKGEGLYGEDISKIRTLSGKRGRALYNPGDVHAVQRKIKQTKRELVPFQDACDEAGLHRSNFYRRVRHIAKPIQLIRGGVKTDYYPKEVVEEIVKAVKAA